MVLPSSAAPITKELLADMAGGPAPPGTPRWGRPRRSSSVLVKCHYGYCVGVIVIVIVPVLSPQLTSTMNAVMPFWKWLPFPLTVKLFEFTVETMLSELNGRFGVCK